MLAPIAAARCRDAFFAMRICAFLLLVRCRALVSSPRRPLSPAPRTLTRLALGADVSVTPLVVGFAMALTAAGKLQFDAYQGERGLGAYLRDGKGYSNSAYKPLEGGAAPDDADAAESLRRELLAAAERGDAAAAAAKEAELYAFLDDRGLRYDDEEP